MDFNALNKIYDSIQKHPKRTMIILCIMALIFFSGVFLKTYIGELGKRAASDSKAEKKVVSEIQIGEIKTGYQSPIIVGDKATITYGVSQTVLERLLKILDEKNVAMEERNFKFQELAQKYNELKEHLAKRSAKNELVAQAKQKLEKGDLESVEKLLLQSLEKNLQAISEKKKDAATDAFELGSVRELQLDYSGAKKYYEQANKLEPDNTRYLRNIGHILLRLGDNKQAIGYYEKALALDLKVYGRQHQNLTNDYNNLSSNWDNLGEQQKAIDYGERFALVIGNAAYPQAPLDNPISDARDMAAALWAIRFQVILRENVNNTAFETAIVEFGNALAQDSVGLFYYSGHGVQVNGRSYLIPIGAKISSAADVELTSIDLRYVLDELAAAGNRVNIVILDACRDNPFIEALEILPGLARPIAPPDTLIAYSAAPNSVALDDRGRNSPYTKHLLKLLNSPGVPVELFFRRVMVAVARSTGGRQVPWEESTLISDFYFVPSEGEHQIPSIGINLDEPVETDAAISINEVFDGPDMDQLRGLAWDGRSLWSTTTKGGLSSRIYRHRIDKTLAVAQAFNSPSAYTVDLAWVNGRMWSVDNMSDRLVKHSPGTYSIDGLFSMNGRRDPEALTYDGRKLYTSNEGVVQIFDSRGGFLGELFSPVKGDFELDFAHGLLLVGQGDTITRYDPQRLRIIDHNALVTPHGLPRRIRIGGMAFDGEHLWIADNANNRIYKASISAP